MGNTGHSLPSQKMVIVMSTGKNDNASMITVAERDTIRTLAEKYSVKRVLVFGSASRGDSGYRDIDLAVEGIKPKDFFRFYGELLNSLPSPVDVVDLSRPSRFVKMILEEGVPIYG